MEARRAQKEGWSVLVHERQIFQNLAYQHMLLMWFFVVDWGTWCLDLLIVLLFIIPVEQKMIIFQVSALCYGHQFVGLTKYIDSNSNYIHMKKDI